MAQSLFKRLREQQPDTAIDVLAPAWTLGLVERMPEIRQAIPMPLGHGELKLCERRQLGRSLRNHHYRQAIVLPNSFKSALLPWFAGIPLRTGFRGEMRFGLLNDPRHLDQRLLPTMVERFVALAEPPGVYPAKRAAPELQISERSRQAALTALGLQTDQPVVGMCPGAEYGPAKRWPARHFAKVADHAAAAGRQVWLFGSARDRPLSEAIRALSAAPCVDLTGRTSLAEACDLLSLCEVVLTNDSGLMHVAAALGRKLICLYGSSDPGFTPPLSDRATILKLDLECSPCFARECRFGHYRCLADLQPELVIRAMEQLSA